MKFQNLKGCGYFISLIEKKIHWRYGYFDRVIVSMVFHNGSEKFVH